MPTEQSPMVPGDCCHWRQAAERTLLTVTNHFCFEADPVFLLLFVFGVKTSYF